MRDAHASGFSLAEIASILDMRDRGEQTCGQIVELFELHLAHVNRQLARLRSAVLCWRMGR